MWPFDPATKKLLGFVLLFLLVAPLFPFIYVVVRWRSAGAREPGAGTFAALLYFRTAGVLLALAGAANLTYGWFSTTPQTEELTRLSWGMFTGSVAFLVLNLLLLRRFGPHPELATARRVFSGFLMVMAGLVAFTTLVILCITLFHKTESDKDAALRADDLKLYGAWTAYYLAAYLASTAWLSRGARGAAA
ncbi:MAG: hypothetical protein ACHQ1G_10810 [Planctomycetota bacterium]